MFLRNFFLVCVGCAFLTGSEDLKNIPACDSNIYCDGQLLHLVQTLEVYKDSKEYVDKSLKDDPDNIWAEFENFIALNPNPTKEEMGEFVDLYFGPTNSEFEDWEPTDWKPDIELYKRIADAALKEFAKSLNDIWKILGRKVKKDVENNPSRYSLLYVSYPFIVPGGRFREFYYWDSYWVIKGLLLSEMTETVKGMLLNFIDIVLRVGHFPNGNRIYYTNRSQPPFLIPMVNDYYIATNDKSFLMANIEHLEKEYDFWMQNRSIFIPEHGVTLNRYAVRMGKPRPEGYKEDLHIVNELGLDEDASAEKYSELASGAESGWDYSTRWFARQGEDAYELKSIRIKRMIPVDLNAILCWNEKLLAKFNNEIGNRHRATVFEEAARQRQEAIDAVLWNEEAGIWLDYDIDNSASISGEPESNFYLSNIMPFYTGCYTGQDKEEKVFNYLKRNGIFDKIGGAPTSLITSGQQWDYPNVWPPLEEVVVTSLSRMQSSEAQKTAQDLAQKWVTSNWKGFEKTGKMFEKYDCDVVGKEGGGGEYDIQDGFGWTNGVILQFLDMYGDVLSAAPSLMASSVCLVMTSVAILASFNSF